MGLSRYSAEVPDPLDKLFVGARASGQTVHGRLIVAVLDACQSHQGAWAGAGVGSRPRANYLEIPGAGER